MSIDLEKDIKLGNDGSLDLSFKDGKAVLALAMGIPSLAISSSVSVQMDAVSLVDAMKKAIEAKSGVGAVAIEEAVFNLLKSALAGL